MNRKKAKASIREFQSINSDFLSRQECVLWMWRQEECSSLLLSCSLSRFYQVVTCYQHPDDWWCIQDGEDTSTNQYWQLALCGKKNHHEHPQRSSARMNISMICWYCRPISPLPKRPDPMTCRQYFVYWIFLYASVQLELFKKDPMHFKCKRVFSGEEKVLSHFETV